MTPLAQWIVRPRPWTPADAFESPSFLITGGPLARITVGGFCLWHDWRDIRALEDCIEEVQERLGGEDPADPMVRDALESAKGIIEMAVSQLGEMQILIELPEPDDDARAPVHRLLDQAVGRDADWRAP